MKKKEVSAPEKFTRAEKSWILYDWANSSYATIMMAAIFPIYFSTVAAAHGQPGDYWWGVGTSAAMALIAVLAPIAGAFADYKGYKKKLFLGFLFTGLLFTLFTAFTDSWQLLLIGYMVSQIGFNGSCLVYDSFLPDVTSRERMDKVSSYGYAFGYIGGSTIPFVISIIFISFGENWGISATAAIKFSIILCVLWWGIFTIPFVKNINQKHGIVKPKNSILKSTFKDVGKTAKNIYQDKKIFFFILAYFFYIDGVGTVIHMSTSYGSTLGLDSTGMILALMVTQLVAFPASILFSILSKKRGPLTMLFGAIVVYIFICILGFVMGFGLEEEFLTLSQALTLFWLLAILVGSVQGGIQAISRSYFGKLIPPENSGEYFGFFDIFGKFASVMGPALYAAAKSLTGRSSLSILSIMILFIIALIILTAGRKHLKNI